jgi:hypothetical protein
LSNIDVLFAFDGAFRYFVGTSVKGRRRDHSIIPVDDGECPPSIQWSMLMKAKESAPVAASREAILPFRRRDAYWIGRCYFPFVVDGRILEAQFERYTIEAFDSLSGAVFIDPRHPDEIFTVRFEDIVTRQTYRLASAREVLALR